MRRRATLLMLAVLFLAPGLGCSNSSNPASNAAAPAGATPTPTKGAPKKPGPPAPPPIPSARD